VRFINHEHGKETLDYVHYYIAIGFTLTSSVLVVLTTMVKDVEESRQRHFSAQPPTTDSETTLLQHLQGSYEFDRHRYPEFAKLCFSEAWYSANVSVKAFLLFFVQDTFRFRDDASAQVLTGNCALAAEAMAVLAAVAVLPYLASPSQKPTANQAEPDDLLGAVRARCAAICGTAWMALLWLGPPAVGYGVFRERLGMPHSPGSVAQHWETVMIAGTALWGLGQGMYIAGDQALRYALLPDRNQASRYLGITGIYTSLGAIAGGGIAGGLLFLFGGLNGERAPLGGSGPGYGYAGYLAVFLFALSVNAVASTIVTTIRLDDKLCESTRILKGVL